MVVRALMAVVVVATLLYVGATAASTEYGAALNASGVNESVNESIPMREGERLFVSDANRTDVNYYNQSQVVVKQTGDRFQAEGNWSWSARNGSIKWLNGTNLDNQSDADVIWGYYRPDSEHKYARFAALTSIRIGDVLVHALGAAAVLAALGWAWGATKR